MADAVVTIGGDINELKRRLKEAGVEIKSFGDKSKKDISGIDFGKALGIAGGIAGLQRLLSVGFRFNQTMGDSQVAIANIIQRFQGLNAVAAKQEAKKAMQAIVALEPQTAATLEGLTQGFLATFASAQQAGISIEQNIDLVGKFANALANANIPADQLVQELRSIFTGNITSDSALAKMLEIRPQDVAAAKEMGRLYEFLNEKVGQLGLSGDTAGVAFSSLASAMDKALGLATEGLFKQSVDGAKDLSQWLDKNADGFRAMGETAAAAMSFIGTTFSYAGGLLDDFLAGLDEASRMLLGLTSKSESDANRIIGAAKEQAGGIAAGFVGGAVVGSQVKATEKAAHAEKKAAMAKEQLLRIARDLERVERMREELGEREFQRILKHMTPLLQVEAIQKRIAQEKERQANEVGPRSEAEILENQKRLMDLEEQLAEAVKRRGEAQVTAAREAADAAAEAAEKTQALMDVEKEMALLEAQAAGKKKEAAAIEREMAVEQTKRAIMSQTGLGEEEALKMAEKMQKLREKVDEREEDERDGKKGGRTIRGYSFKERGGAKEKLTGLLDEYYALQQGPRLNETWKFPGLDAYRKMQDRGGPQRQNPSETMAAKSAKDATTGKDLSSQMEKLIDVTTRGLLSE